MEESEWIDSYLQGKLSETELAWVESKIANDKEFKRKLILRKAIMAGISEAYAEELKQKLKAHDRSLETKKFTIQFSWKMAAVLTGILVVTTTLLFVLYKSKSKTLKSYDLTEIGVPNVMGLAKDNLEFVNAMNHFKAGNYAVALAEFQDQLQHHPASDTLQYFIAVAAYRTGNSELAIKLFSRVPASSVYFEISEYRLALSYLARNQRDQAFEQFSVIATKPGHKYKMEALRVLSEQF